MSIFLHYLNFTKYNLLIHHNPNVTAFNYTFIGECNGDYSNSHPDSTVQTPKQPCSPVIPLPIPLSPNTLHATSGIIYHREPIIQHNYVSLLSKLVSQHSHPHNFPPCPNNCPQPCLQPHHYHLLDLTPPTQNTSESDISDDFLDPNYQ